MDGVLMLRYKMQHFFRFVFIINEQRSPLNLNQRKRDFIEALRIHIFGVVGTIYNVYLLCEEPYDDVLNCIIMI